MPSGRRHKTLPDWARQLLLVVRRWWPDRPLVAALYEPAPPRRPRQIGRPRLKGKRLPTLATVAADPATAWTPLTVAQWYGLGARAVEVASATAVWYHPGQPTVPLRWVLIRDPQAK